MEATFYYRARTSDGFAVTGSMVADSADTVLAHLRTRALFVTSIAAQGTLDGRLARLRGLGRVSPSAFVAFFRSFATMLSAGVSIQRALAVEVAQSSDRRLKEALQSVLAGIESGRSLSAAMSVRPREFPPLYVAMIEAGESGGMLDEVLERLASMLERNYALRRRVLAALTYPAIVFCAAIFLIFFLIATIVPTFGRMFQQLDVPVPLPTRILMSIGEAMGNGQGLLALAVAAALIGYGTIAIPRSATAARAFDSLRFRLPVLGKLQRRAVTARVARMLGSLLRSGVDVLRAVEIVAPLARSNQFTRALRALGIALREGDSLTEPLEKEHVLEPLALQLIRVGEESGSLDRMLLKVADYYEADVEAGMLAFSATVEPILIFFVGLIVAGIVFSVFVPMYSLVGQIH